MSCSLTIQGLFCDGLGLTPDIGLCDISKFSGLVDHGLDSDGVGSVMEAGTPLTGGVDECVAAQVKQRCNAQSCNCTV
jgi:hypothetical protein